MADDTIGPAPGDKPAIPPAIAPSDAASREQMRFAELVMEFFDHLREEHGDTFGIDIGLMAAEVSYINADGEVERRTDYFSTDDRAWVTTGFVERLQEVAEDWQSEREGIPAADEDESD